MDNLPMIRLQDLNAYEMGFSIGSHFAPMIQSRIAKDPNLSSTLLPFALSEPGERLIQSLSTTNRERYPEFWEELHGLADGSGVPFLEVLLLNFRKEVGSFLPQNAVSIGAGEPDQCSDVLLCSDHLAVIAHNEDADESVKDHVYLVHATLKNGTSFFAYTYAGELPSCAFGFNNHGVAFTVNSVPPIPEEMVPGAIGRNFVCRDLLEATNVSDALNRIKGAQLSAGHSYNVMDINMRRILNIEAASRERYSVQDVKEVPLFHANMYLHLLEVHQVRHESSIHRQKRAAELPKSTEEEMLILLGDTHDQSFPVYMHDICRCGLGNYPTRKPLDLLVISEVMGSSSQNEIGRSRPTTVHVAFSCFQSLQQEDDNLQGKSCITVDIVPNSHAIVEFSDVLIITLVCIGKDVLVMYGVTSYIQPLV